MNKNIDVINYRPDLKMDHIPSLDVVYNDKVNEQANIKYTTPTVTNCLSEFKEYAPSETISSLEDVLSQIRTGMDRIISEMSNTKAGKKFLDSTAEDREIIVNQNYNDPYGSTYIESYVELEKIEKEVESITQDYSMYTYGDDISYEKAKLIDDGFVDKITLLEGEGDKFNVGYTSLYYETMISNMLKLYAHRVSDEALPYIVGITEMCKDMPFSDKYSKILLNNFEKKQEILKNDILKDEKSTYNIRVALKNAFLALQEYEDSLSAVDGCDILIEDEELGLEIKGDALSNLADSLLVLMHTLYYSPIAKSDIGNSLRNKSDIREYFIE